MKGRSICAVAVAMLCLPVVAQAASLPAGARQDRERVSAPERRVAVTARARAMSHDRLGNNWVFHGLDEVRAEVKAAAVTLIRPNGSLRTFFASDLLPQGTVAPGMAGQVFTISPMTTPGYYAATVGYVSREHYTRNAVVVFALGDDGEPRTVRVIQIRNAAQVIGGPRDTMIVTAADPLDSATFALATVFDIDGNVHAELMTFGAPNLIEAAKVTRAVRLQQSGAEDFALFDPQSRVVQHYSLARAGNLPSLADATPSPEMRAPRRAAYPEISLAADWTVSVDNPGVGGSRVELGRLLDFHVDDATQTVTLARNVSLNGVPSAVVSRYDGRDVEAWMSDGPWNATLWRRDAIDGFGPRGGLVEQHVSLKGGIAVTATERPVRAPRTQQSGCAAWMTGRQCAQISAAELSIADVRRFRNIIAHDNGGGEGCFDDGGNMCANSVQECMDYWVECNLDDEGNTYWMNCTLDYCMYDACYPWDCWQDRQKICCPDGPTVTTTSGGVC